MNVCSSPRSGFAQIICGVPIICGVLIVSACDRSSIEPAEATYKGEEPIHVVLRQVNEVVLQEDSAHVIGGLGRLVVDSSHNVYLADNTMRDVKSWTSSGAFRGVWGRVGQGPGEYLFPSAVAIHPQDGTVGVLDALGSRIVFYDSETAATVETRALAVPVSLTRLALGGGDTLYVAGVAMDYGSEQPHVAALLTEVHADGVPLLPLPTRFQGRLFGGSLISGFLDRGDDYVFMGFRGGRVIYRADVTGSTLDSLMLPEAFFEEPELPALSMVDDVSLPEVQGFIKERDWTSAIVAIDDEHLLVERTFFSADDELWLHHWGLLIWQEEPSFISFPPCHCYAVAGENAIGMLEGSYPRPYTLTWYSLQ